MKHTTTGLALIVVLTMSPGVQARSIMSEYYRTLQDAHEAAGQYAPDHDRRVEDLLEEQNDNLEALQQELRALQYQNSTGCNRGRGQVTSASIHC